MTLPWCRIGLHSWGPTAAQAGSPKTKLDVIPVLAAADDVIREYYSHGGKDTHQECLPGCQCMLTDYMGKLQAELAELFRVRSELAKQVKR